MSKIVEAGPLNYDILITFPSSSRVKSVSFVYTATATVGNRFIEFRYRLSDNTIISRSRKVDAGAGIVASEAWQMNFDAGLPFFLNQQSDLRFFGWLPDIEIPAGGNLLIFDETPTPIDVADATTNIVVVYDDGLIGPNIPLATIA